MKTKWGERKMSWVNDILGIDDSIVVFCCLDDC